MDILSTQDIKRYLNQNISSQNLTGKVNNLMTFANLKIVKTALDEIKNRKRAVTITMGNEQGGTARTTNSTFLSYVCAKMGLRVLYVDLDPRADGTRILTKTHSRVDINHSRLAKSSVGLMTAIENHNLRSEITNIFPKLDIIEGDTRFRQFPRHLYLELNNQYDYDHVIDSLLTPLKSDYDLIFIDIPSSIYEISRNALVTSDYVLVSLQLQEPSMQGIESLIGTTLKEIIDDYPISVNIIGIVKSLVNQYSPVDKYIARGAEDEYGINNLFDTEIKEMQHIKRASISGIQDIDSSDWKVLNIYGRLACELILRIRYVTSLRTY